MTVPLEGQTVLPAATAAHLQGRFSLFCVKVVAHGISVAAWTVWAALSSVVGLSRGGGIQQHPRIVTIRNVSRCCQASPGDRTARARTRALN